MMQSWVAHAGLLAIIAVPLVFIILAVCGIHPLILIVVIGKILMALTLPLPTLSIALLLMLSCAVSYIVSPFAGMVMTASKFLPVSPFEVAIKWNVLFCVIFLIEGVLFACLWR